MPKQTYEVVTDKGTYEIDVDEPKPLAASEKSTVTIPKSLLIPGVGSVPVPGGGQPFDLKEFGSTALDAAKGYAKGLIPGAVGAVKDLALAPIGLAKAAIGGVGDIASIEEAYRTGGVEAGRAALTNMLAGASDTVKQKVYDALDLARRDPEAFGEKTGELTGAAETGIATVRALPLAPKPVARAVGRSLEKIGGAGGFPLRVAGAHQVLSGNPLGFATMVMPEAIQKTGQGMIRFGGGLTGEDAALNDKFVDAMTRRNVSFADEQAKATAALAKRKIDPTSSGVRTIDAGPIPKGTIRVAPATGLPQSERIPYGAGEPAPYRASAKAAVAADEKATENATRLAKIDEALAGKDRAEPTGHETLSAETPEGGRRTVSIHIGGKSEPPTPPQEPVRPATKTTWTDDELKSALKASGTEPNKRTRDYSPRDLEVARNVVAKYPGQSGLLKQAIETARKERHFENYRGAVDRKLDRSRD